MNDEMKANMREEGDAVADAVVAVVLIAIFVATCIFWIAGQTLH